MRNVQFQDEIIEIMDAENEIEPTKRSCDWHERNNDCFKIKLNAKKKPSFDRISKTAWILQGIKQYLKQIKNINRTCEHKINREFKYKDLIFLLIWRHFNVMFFKLCLTLNFTGD